ncbi:hypothetical protein LMH87_003592 [Akanthomyces muscarius]|uniref:Uncharacterized protein n=1 Tax=Akanthomyces muscarius TaxID=2231603 RepID=A0A9W8UH26_AKAMU|nr:hypothetical protein LMH87_003592 [Akanthomyces muscarius]KAJ4144720.1 hypothetical protein LMH87_003592 [Akanthomyces muscarius]
MPRKSAKSEASTASPDPAPVKSTPAKASSASARSTPAKSVTKKDKDTPAKTVSAKSTPASKSTKAATKDKDATATPASAKQRRQSKPRASSSAADKQVQRSSSSSSSNSLPRKALLADLPPAGKFVAVEALTFALLFAGRFALATVTGDEMGTLRTQPETAMELLLLAGWRAAEVALAWVANLDFIDVGLVSFVAHAPSFWLLAMFYGIRPATAVAGTLIDVAAPAAAFALARPLGSLRFAGPRLYNKDLVSGPFQVLIAALSTNVYAAVVSLSLRFLLPRVFVLYFHGIPTVAPAYSASFLALLPTALFFGVAASKFIFAPYVTTGKSKEDEKIRQFDPVQASLRETVWWNFWGYTLRSRIVITRTAIVTVMTAVSTYLALAIAIDGVSCLGAATYALVWASATAGTGLALGLVGQE